MSTPTNLKTNLIRAAKILVSLGIVWAAWRWFLKIDNPALVWNALSHIPWWVHVLALAVSAANWFTETLKWQNLLRHLNPLKLRKAWASTLAGAAVSNIFPFRIGEYLGRILYIEADNRIPAAFNSVFGSMCQMAVTLLFGIPAATMALSVQNMPLLRYAVFALFAIVIISALLLLLLPRWRGKQKWIKKIADDARQFTLKQVAATLGYSLLRFFIFGGFYAWLLVFSGLFSAYTAVLGVATIFLLQSFAPSMIVTDAGIRTALPLMVFSVSVAEQPLLLALALMNYFYSVLLPGLTGLIYILLKKAREI
jgi:hypothetical protein